MNDLHEIVRDAAQRHRLPPAVVCGLVETESKWNPWAARYEPAFFTRYIDKSAMHIIVREFCRKADFFVNFDTELRERAFSKGLGQLMGQTARELGYIGPLSRLYEPHINITWCCKLLKRNLDKCTGDMTKALLKYNGGADPTYAERVLARTVQYSDVPDRGTFGTAI